MSFEEWFAEYSKYWSDSTKADVNSHIDVIEAAYNTGVVAERERCAKVAEVWVNFYAGSGRDIAAAIRKGEALSPLTARVSPTVPIDEIHIKDRQGQLLGMIVNVKGK